MSEAPLRPPVSEQYLRRLGIDPARLSPAAFGVRYLFNQVIPMRDGAVLRADLYLPDGDGPFPAILTRLPYGKQSDFSAHLPGVAKWFAQHGYVYVVQDVRGRYESDGAFVPFMNERNDGLDTLDWIASQSWSSGAVGMRGDSYYGFTQLILANSGHPALKCCVVGVSTTGHGSHGIPWAYRQGAFRMYEYYTWWVLLDGRANQSWEIDVESVGRAFRHLPMVDGGRPMGRSFSWIRDWLEHPEPNEYWERLQGMLDPATFKVPILHETGWWDVFIGEQLADFERSNAAGVPDQRLIVGGWDHFAMPVGEHYGYDRATASVDLGPDANLPLLEVDLQWYDRWLRGVENGDERQPAVRYFMLGANQWRESATWPPAGATTRTLYLASGGCANTRGGDGRLTADAAAGHSDRFDYDPMRPVRTPVRDWWRANSSLRDQGANQDRDDVLCYTSDPLEVPLTIAGRVWTRLWASTSGPDTDFTARVTDIAPDDTVTFVAEGIVRGRYRDGPPAKLLEPGRAYEFSIDLWEVAYRFEAGHRLRLEVSSSNFPRFDRNLNTAKPTALEDTPVIAHQAVYHDAEHPSRLELPVLEPWGGGCDGPDGAPISMLGLRAPSTSSVGMDSAREANMNRTPAADSQRQPHTFVGDPVFTGRDKGGLAGLGRRSRRGLLAFGLSAAAVSAIPPIGRATTLSGPAQAVLLDSMNYASDTTAIDGEMPRPVLAVSNRNVRGSALSAHLGPGSVTVTRREETAIIGFNNNERVHYPPVGVTGVAQGKDSIGVLGVGRRSIGGQGQGKGGVQSLGAVGGGLCAPKDRGAPMERPCFASRPTGVAAVPPGQRTHEVSGKASLSPDVVILATAQGDGSVHVAGVRRLSASAFRIYLSDEAPAEGLPVAYFALQ